MSGAKHTPGPWTVDEHATTITCAHAKNGSKVTIFEVYGWGYLTGPDGLDLDSDEGMAGLRANASLAAAAPDLLAALREAQAMIGAVDLEDAGDDYLASWQRGIATVDAALAKAEGRS